MMKKKLFVAICTFTLICMSACHDQEDQKERIKKEGLKSVLNQSNNKQLSDEEIKAALHRNNSSKTSRD